MKNFRISPWVIGIVLVAVLIIWPLLKPGFFISDDGEWMIIRLSAFFQSLREGQFPVRFLGRLNNSYGYPVANFLYPGFLYLGSLIHVFGISFVNTVKLIFIGSIIGSAVCIFYWLKRFFSAKASFLGAIGFIFTPYLLFDTYKRGSVGEVLAAFAVSALLLFIETNTRWAIPLLTALLVLSHNSLGFLFLLFIIFYLIARKRTNLFIPILLGIGLSAFFWFPALFEQKFIMFPTVIVSNPNQYFLSIQDLFLFGFVNVIAFVFVMLKKEKKKVIQLFFLCIFGLTIVCATQISAPVWTAFPILGKLFQFPYRFLSLAFIAGPWLIASCIEKIVRRDVLRGSIIFFSLLWLFPAISILLRIQFVNRPEGYYTTNEATTTVANEYMPRWVREFPKDRGHARLVFYQGRGKIDAKTLSTQKIDAVIFADEQSIIQLNSIYYPGWGIAIDDQYIAPDYQNVYGLMRVPLSSGKHRFVAEFRETIPRFIADAGTVAAGVAYIIYICWIQYKRLKHKVL